MVESIIDVLEDAFMQPLNEKNENENIKAIKESVN